MRHGGWGALLGMAALPAACDGPYEAPCEVRSHQVALAAGFTPDLQVSGDGEVWATGWQIDDDDDASTRLAGVATFTPDGAVLAQWVIPVPVLPTDVLGGESPLQWAWTGQALAAVRKITDVLPPDDSGEHLRSVLSLRSVAPDGTAALPVELLATSCIDCQLSWTMRALAGRVVVLYQPRTLTTDPEEPLEDGVTHYLIVDPAGQVLATGTLPGEPTDDDLGRFVVDPLGQGFWLSTAEGVVHFDRDMQWVAGPYAPGSQGPTPVESGGDTVHAAWSDDFDNVVQQSFAVDGSPLGPVERLTHGTAQAIRATARGIGVVARDDGEAFFVWSVDGQKVGGDTLLPDIRGGWPALGALFVDGRHDYALFLGDKNQVDRLELSCER